MPDGIPTLAPDEFTGRRLGKYEIACRLSSGGMSEVFLAFVRGAEDFRKYVVLKKLLENVRGQEDVLRMFVDEAKITAGFSHNFIAQVYDLDVSEGELFLAMEFVPGATLVELAKACAAANEPIPTGFTLAVVRDTALALHYAHTFTDPAGRVRPVLHRDVAEKNIMVTFDGMTKLLDFGIAKRLDRPGQTQIGTVKGTSGYMSPEQIRGERLDARSDLFSLGVVLHECLSGQRLFYRKSREEELVAPLHQEPPLPSRRNREVTPALDAVALRALAKDREQRFATAKEFARALERSSALLWEPEQCGSLIQRLFAERRAQTRNLLQQTGDESFGDLEGSPTRRDRPDRPDGKSLLDDPTGPVQLGDAVGDDVPTHFVPRVELSAALAEESKPPEPPQTRDAERTHIISEAELAARRAKSMAGRLSSGTASETLPEEAPSDPFHPASQTLLASEDDVRNPVTQPVPDEPSFTPLATRLPDDDRLSQLQLWAGRCLDRLQEAARSPVGLAVMGLLLGLLLVGVVYVLAL